MRGVWWGGWCGVGGFLFCVFVDFFDDELAEFFWRHGNGFVFAVFDGLVFFDDEVHDFFADFVMWWCWGWVCFGEEEAVAVAFGAAAMVRAGAVFEDVSTLKALVGHR